MSEEIITTFKPPVPFPRSYWVVPGLFLAGEYPGNIDPDITERKIAAMIDLGIRHVVDLMESDEIYHADGPSSSYEEMLVNIGAARGCHVSRVRFQVVDYHVPSPDRMKSILDNIDASIEADRPVYIHCWGGLGRTGTVIGCHLLRHGLAAPGNVFDTIARLRQNDPYARRVSPQNEKQVNFVRSWHGYETGPPSRLNRYLGCLVGGAAGDALGAPVEFMGIGEILASYGEHGITDFDTAYGRVGAITDDTQMAMFTAEGLLRARAQKAEPDSTDTRSALHASYVRWLNTQGFSSRSIHDGSCESILIHAEELRNRRGPGKTCISALRRKNPGTIENPANDSKGCGGAMRIAPVGLMADSPESAFETACEAAAITHGHPTGYLAAGAFAAVINLLKGGRKLADAVERVLPILENRPYHEECAAAVKASMEMDRWSVPPGEAIEALGSGWTAGEALSISLYCALRAGNDFQQGVIMAVNHGGDSDSTGAMTGNLLGTLLGSTSIPEKWKDRLELSRLIQKLAVDLFIGYRDARWWRVQYGDPDQ